MPSLVPVLLRGDAFLDAPGSGSLAQAGQMGRGSVQDPVPARERGDEEGQNEGVRNEGVRSSFFTYEK
jgi:hypothetical protein